MLNDLEQKKYDTIKKLVDGTITRKEASFVLNLCLKQIDRLKKVYLSKGKDGFIHGNRGKNSPNKIDENLIFKLKDLYLIECYDYNFEQFFEEEVYGKYNISYATMLKRFTDDDIISPLAHKKTVRKYKEKLKSIIDGSNNSSDDPKIKLYKSRMIEVNKAHIRRSNNLYKFGQEIQMDACQKLWFGEIVSYLHLAVDKATKKVLFGWFEYEEITRGYYVVLFHIIINYGIPEKIKADNRSSFTANKTDKKSNEKFLTQFGKACEELNIVLETTSVATAKANVERENKTFKDRLIAELRRKGITTIDEANKYLNEEFIPKINKNFSYAIDENKSLMRENNYTVEELKLIISEKHTRIIDNASSVSYNRKYYIPTNIETGEIVNFMKGTKCTFIINYDGDEYAEIENQYYKMLKLETRDSVMKKESETITNKKEHHKYIPPANHPWRKNMMLKH